MSSLKNKNTAIGKKGATLTAVALGVVMATASSSSSALSISSVLKFLGISAEQGEAITFRWLVNSTQSAIEPLQTAKAMKQINQVNATISVVDNNTQRMADLVLDNTPGVGIPTSLGCTVAAEKSQAQSQILMGQDEAFNDSLASARDYIKPAATKLAQRTENHLLEFCDVTEAKSGICVPSSRGAGGKDSDYSNIHGNNILADGQLDAAYAYVQQTIDPASQPIQGCTTSMCTSISDNDRAYKGLASMVQSSFFAQIQDATLHTYGKIGSDLNVKVDSEGLGYLPNEVNPPPTTPVVKPSSCDAEALSVGIKHYKYDETPSSALVNIGDGRKLHKDAAAALNKMREAANNAGVSFEIGSAFRPNSYQQGIIDKKKAQGMSLKEIYKASAPAGYSEHSTGYVVDFSPIDSSFAKTPAYTWLKANAGKFGWVQSFTAESTKSSGVMIEPWHWKYTGTPEAQKVFSDKKCM